MPILEVSELEAVLSLDLSQIDPLQGFEIHNSEIKPASIIHLQLNDAAAGRKPVSWLRACLTGSQAELIIHSSKVPLAITPANFINFKGIKLDSADIDLHKLPSITQPPESEIFDIIKIAEAKDFLRHYVQNPAAKLPDFSVLERFLPVPELYTFSIMVMQHAVKNHGSVPTGIMMESMVGYLAENPDTKQALVTSFILSSLKLDIGHLKHLDLAKLAQAMDVTQNSSTGTYIARLMESILSKEFKPHPKLKVILQQIIDKDEDTGKTRNCKLFLSKIAPDEEVSDNLTAESYKTKFLDPRLNSEDLKGETKSFEALLTEISQLNGYDHVKIKSLHSKFDHVTASYLHDSKLMPQGIEIKNWDEGKIKTWAEKVKSIGVACDKNSIFELLAVIKRANLLYCNQNLRDVQILSLLTFAESADRGILAQIATGEGKSTITACLAAIQALEGKKTDVVTSSPVLAKRDAFEKSRFFQMFGLSVGHNCDQTQGNLQGPRNCYTKDIVYGDISSFQYDTLRHHHLQKGTRGERSYQVVIVDEVDSIMIDENNKIAMLSGHTPASEYMEPLFGVIASELARFNQHVVYSKAHDTYVYVNGAFSYDAQTTQVTLSNENGEIYSNIDNMQKFRFEHLKSYVTKIIEYDLVPVPLHLKTMALSQVENWIRSAVTASGFIEKKDYLILRDDKGKEVIAPIDYNNTGLIHAKTTWTNGLHQFLQIKHGLKLTPENLTTSFISNLSYLKLYGKSIYGMTGTLGSEDSKMMLREIYNVDLASMPTYKPKRFEELTPTLASSNEEWLSSIVRSSLLQSSAGRASLIICESIRNVELIRDALIGNSYPENRIRLYSRNDTSESKAVDDIVECGDIIIATNLAGRGTDLKTTRALEENGGLHVCVTFLPSNLRVEQQAFGRTSRQGNHGTAELVINTSEADNMLRISEEYELTDINSYKRLRDQREQSKLRNIMLYDAKLIELEDLLFGNYSRLMHELKAQEESKSKLAQLEENWGIFLKDLKQAIADKKKAAISLKDRSLEVIDKFNAEMHSIADESFQAFKSRMREEYGNKYQIIRNPAHLVLEGFNNMSTGQYAKSAELFALAAKLDDNFSSPAHYNAAYAIIRGKVGNYKQEAFTNLELAKRDIEQTLIPNLELLQVTAVMKQDSALAKQIVAKIELLKLQLKYIGQSQSKIADCASENEIEIAESKLLRDFFEADNSPKDEILELNLFGIHNLFDVKEVEPPTDNFAAIFMAISSVVQIGVGLALASTGNIGIGASLIIEGLKDSMQAIEMADGKQIKWDSYFTNKGISLAVTVIAKGAENLITKLTTVPVSEVVAKEALQEAAKESAKIVILSEAAKKAANQELVKATLKEVVKRVVVNTAIDKVADQAAGNILAEFKDEIKGKVESKIENCLNHQRTHEQFIRLMELDDFNNDRENYIKIYKAALSILERKESLLTGIVKSVISQMASSSSAHVGVKAVASLMQVAEIAKALQEVTNLTDQLGDKLSATIAGLIQKAQGGDLASAIQKKMTTVDAVRSKDIVKALEQQGYVQNNRVIKIHNIEQADFKNNSHLKEYIIRHIKKLYEAQSKDYSQVQQKFTQDLTAYVSKAMMGTIRSEIMMPASSSPLAKLSQIVTDGIAKTAAEFASVIRTEAMVLKNANQIREGQQVHAQEFGVGAGDEEGGGYTGNKLAGNKAKEKNSSTKRGSSSNNNNNNEWQNPDAALMRLMTDPSKLTALRNQREAGQRAQQEGITPETAQYLKSVLYVGGEGSRKSGALTAGEVSANNSSIAQNQEKQSLPEMAGKALVTGVIETLDILKPLAIASLTEDMFTAQAFGIGKIAEENARMFQEQIRQVEKAPPPSEAIKDALRTHTGLDITPKPETTFERVVVGTFKTGGSLASFGGIGGAAARFIAGSALGGTSSLLQETGMPPIAAEVGAIASTALAFKGGVAAFNKLGSQYTEKILESAAKLPHKAPAIETANMVVGKIEHKLPTDFKNFDFPITKAVEIPADISIKPTILGKYYEEAVCKQFEISKPKNYRTSLDGRKIQGKADHVIEEGGKKIAIDAKYVDNWAESIRNPTYTSNKPWLVEGGEQEMIVQARKYSSSFSEFRYYTNSPELAEQYTKVFHSEGITNFKFIITPAIKK